MGSFYWGFKEKVKYVVPAFRKPFLSIYVHEKKGPQTIVGTELVIGTNPDMTEISRVKEILWGLGKVPFRVRSCKDLNKISREEYLSFFSFEKGLLKRRKLYSNEYSYYFNSRDLNADQMRFYVTDTSNLKNAVSFQISSHDKQPEYATFSMLAKNIFSCKYEISKTKYYVSKDGYKEALLKYLI